MGDPEDEEEEGEGEEDNQAGAGGFTGLEGEMVLGVERFGGG
jgi:hypothetical protein